MAFMDRRNNFISEATYLGTADGLAKRLRNND